MSRSERVGAASPVSCCAESVGTGAGGRSARPVARLGRHRPPREAGASRLAAHRRDQHRPGGLGVHARNLGTDGPVVRPHPGHEIRDAERRRTQGRRPVGERRAGAAPGPQRARRVGDRPGFGAADRLGVDDPNVHRLATGRSRLRAARGGPDVPRFDSQGAHRAIRNKPLWHHEQIARAPGTGAWRRVGGSLVIRDDGRQQRQYSDFRRRIS